MKKLGLNKIKLFIYFAFIFCIACQYAYAEEIIVKKIYPPKCSIIESTNARLCPRIMELDIEIKGEDKKKLIRCILYSEEGEILAFGEAVMRKPGGLIYIELRERRRIHGITLIAGAKCKEEKY